MTMNKAIHHEDPAWQQWPWRRGQGHLWGLVGAAGSGKSTAARGLQGAGWLRESFAKPIREAVLLLYPDWDHGHFEHPLKEEVCPWHGVTPRAAMRVVGEHARDMDEEIYVRALAVRLRRLVAHGVERIVVDDVRLPLESCLIRDLGGRIVHLDRPGVTFRQDHVTEMGIDRHPYDVTMTNDEGHDEWVTRWHWLGTNPTELGRDPWHDGARR